MKKIFFKTLILVLLSLAFCYMVIDIKGADGKSTTVSAMAANTGVSIIGILFIIPSFVFTILAMTVNEKKVLEFCSNMFGTFCGCFCLISGVVAIIKYTSTLYVPIVLIVVSSLIFVVSLIGIIKSFKLEKAEKNKEN